MDAAALVAAIETLVERGVGVVNLSLSGPPNAILEQAVASAHARGVVLVAAAGNEGPGAEPSYPGAYPEVVAVTAVDRDLNIYKRATVGDYVDLAGPGVNLWTAAKGRSARSSGTSYAVPFVTAAAALLRAANSDLSPGEVLSGISLTAQDLGPAGRDPVFGWGLVQPARLCTLPRGGQQGVEKASIGPPAPQGLAQPSNTMD
jgi:subtilisin family serine protease